MRKNSYIAGINTQWQADLAVMQNIAPQTNDLRYPTTVIYELKKYVQVAPTKFQNAAAVIAACCAVFFDAAQRRPNILHTDNLKEILNLTFSFRTNS